MVQSNSNIILLNLIKSDRLSPILNISLTTKVGLISSTLIAFFVVPGLYLQSTSNKAIATYQSK
ncbi:MAG: hypothetical protein QNJ34_26440 [Xenococcaceae cyanobacterium MO_188.B29]|nr:hypothetical protein [Xenococcaceae cyanobacterium MO_188.B29]